MVPDQGVGRQRLDTSKSWCLDLRMRDFAPTSEIEKDLGQDTRGREHDPNAACTSCAPRGLENVKERCPAAGGGGRKMEFLAKRKRDCL